MAEIHYSKADVKTPLSVGDIVKYQLSDGVIEGRVLGYTVQWYPVIEIMDGPNKGLTVTLDDISKIIR